MKILESELERAHIETSSLSSRIESALQMKDQVQEKLSDREDVIQSLTETIDQLVSLMREERPIHLYLHPFSNLSCLIDSLTTAKPLPSTRRKFKRRASVGGADCQARGCT